MQNATRVAVGTAEKPEKSVYMRLKELSLPHLERYKEDLTEIDRDMLRRFKGIPFIHWTRSSGTHMVVLRPADHESFPPPGKKVRYLFGYRNREGCLDGMLEGAQAYNGTEDLKLIVISDNKGIRKITKEQAIQIIKDHQRKVRMEWRRKPSIGRSNETEKFAFE